MQKFIFSIPDSNSNNLSPTVANVRLLNWAVLEAMKLHKEWFYDDFVIETAYGCPPGCKWNGNRSLGLDEEFDEGWTETVFGLYAEYGLKYRLIFTNFLLRQEHLRDAVGNAVAKTLSKVGGYVMVSTQLMANYMARYPALEVNWSTTTDFGRTTEEQIAKINRLSEKRLVVLPIGYNNQPELKRFTNPQNIEVLVNETCLDSLCPCRREHWTDVNRVILGLVKEADIPQKIGCRYPGKIDAVKMHRHHIPRSMLKEYQQMGINHFKISGRVDPLLAMIAYEDYFMRREHVGEVQMFVREFLEKFVGKS